ncbi:hypothetical protein [Paraflavitalea speifideaquila]|uniref:hypothetical protein n=1 Tax=Paraflavitalea speifideaquila TaxID=3076558 RepID=UPI0028EBF213|nr:hypothetical protein [Paraflavitalea speifideiaquila]
MHQHAHASHSSKGSRQQAKGKAVKIMMVFMGVLGLFVAYVSAGPDLLWLTIGTAAGVVAGYFVGRSMDKAAAKKVTPPSQGVT